RRRPLHYVLGIDDISASQRYERLREVTFAVTRRLGEAVVADAAFGRILQGLCQDLGWDVGQLWIRDRDEEVLRLRDSWHASSPEVAEAATASLEPGTFHEIDLPRRVLADRAPVGLVDVAKDANLADWAAAVGPGQHGGSGVADVNGAAA